MKSFQSIFLVAAVISCLGTAFSQQGNRNAARIVDKMTKQFAIFHSYQNSGSFSLVRDIKIFKGKTWEDALTSSDFDGKDSLSFDFYYARPNRLRFDWLIVDSPVSRKSVVWSNGAQSYSWTPSGANSEIFVWEKKSSLKWAIEEGARGSSNVLDILANALMGSKEYYSFNKVLNARIVREEQIDGFTCYLVIGYLNRDPWALWIDKKNFLLRRYRVQIATGSFDESVETGYMPLTIGEVNYRNIKTDENIPKVMFDYKPKLEKKDMDISRY